jgi:hypothetical protein
MKNRASQINFRGYVSHRREASTFLERAGDAVLVHRGVARSVAIACPDGCGEELTINVDRRSGPAWRYYLDGSRQLSLYPSVWRDTGCGSHFIVWHSKIYWCDWDEELDSPLEEVAQQTYDTLTDDFVSYLSIADSLELVPWAVLSACRSLRKKGLAESGHGKLKDHFRRKPKK